MQNTPPGCRARTGGGSPGLRCQVAVVSAGVTILLLVIFLLARAADQALPAAPPGPVAGQRDRQPV